MVSGRLPLLLPLCLLIRKPGPSRLAEKKKEKKKKGGGTAVERGTGAPVAYRFAAPRPWTPNPETGKCLMKKGKKKKKKEEEGGILADGCTTTTGQSIPDSDAGGRIRRGEKGEKKRERESGRSRLRRKTDSYPRQGHQPGGPHVGLPERRNGR